VAYVTVIGDSVFTNGKPYKVLKWMETTTDSGYYGISYMYYRTENSKRVYVPENYNDCKDKEYVMFDFSVPPKTFWDICGPLSHFEAFGGKGPMFIGLYNTEKVRLHFYPTELPTWYFTSVIIDTMKIPRDTIWTGPTDGPIGSYIIARGFGIIEIQPGWGDFYELHGAIINGVKYGYVTGIKNEQNKSIVNNINISAYPNPFNGQTNIRITNNKSQFAEVSVYNLLGQIVKTIYKGELEKGNYNFHLSSTELASGAYLVCFKTPSLIKTSKIINLK